MTSPHEHTDLLVELVGRALDVLEEDGHGALEAFLAEHPEHAATIRRRLSMLAGSGLHVSDEDVGALRDAFEDFELEEAVGRGGMGVVWRARQRSLGREVALKLVRPDQLLFPGARERFRREVETIARLQHPGIVPVYAVGEERGLPYYAMELVRGATLADVVDHLHGRDPATLRGGDVLAVLPAAGDGADPEPPSALFDGSWHDVCLRIVREVAEALEHARRRGVVHRDVKPSNVMLTRGGRVLLLDFGLSVVQGDERLTKSGTTVGSIAYMAPERMPGSPDREGAEPDDPRQDVYSLGVTLYELLALASPYRSVQELGLVRAALEGDVVPLRTRNRAVPPETATVVAVAMDRDPARRYADAGAMARDLAAALERRPLEARPPGPLLRARRWVQRHPLAATLYAAAVVVPSILLVQEARNVAVVEGKNAEIEGLAGELSVRNEDLADALERTSSQRARAEAALGQAMLAVERMLVRVGDEALLDVPGLDEVRRDLLDEALEFQRWFLANAERTDALRERVARIAVRTAEVHGLLDDPEAAEEALALAASVLDEPAGVEALDEAGVPLRARALAVRAKVAALRQHQERADEARAAALAALGSAEASPAEAALAAGVRVDRALDLQNRGDLGAAERELEQAIELAAPLHDGWDGAEDRVRELRSELARAFTTLALVRDTRVQRAPGAVEGRFDQGLVASGLEAAEEAVRLAEALLALEPDSAGVRHRLARATSVLGILSSRAGDLPGSVAASERTVELLERLSADHPAVPTYHFDLATALANLGGQLRLQGDAETGEALTRRGIDALRDYFRAGGDELRARFSFVGMLLNLASMRQMAGDPEDALPHIDEALGALDTALERSPDDPQARYIEAVALDQSLVHLALHGRGDALTRHLRGFLGRADGLDGRLDVLAQVATWPDAAVAAGRFDDEQVETLVRTLEDAVAAVCAEGLADGSLPRERLAADARLDVLRGLGRVAEALEAR